MIYAIMADVVKKEKDGIRQIDVPTFYLDSVVQGIVGAKHAEKIARDIINPTGDPDLTVNVTAYPVADNMPGEASGTLTDQLDHGGMNSLPVKVKVVASGVYIYPEGYGDKCSEPPGTPVYVELAGGKLRAVVFPDINEETPTVIDLSNAKETNRRE